VSFFTYRCLIAAFILKLSFSTVFFFFMASKPPGFIADTEPAFLLIFILGPCLREKAFINCRLIPLYFNDQASWRSNSVLCVKLHGHLFFQSQDLRIDDNSPQSFEALEWLPNSNFCLPWCTSFPIFNWLDGIDYFNLWREVKIMQLSTDISIRYFLPLWHVAQSHVFKDCLLYFDYQ